MELYSDAEYEWSGLARENINKTLHYLVIYEMFSLDFTQRK